MEIEKEKKKKNFYQANLLKRIYDLTIARAKIRPRAGSSPPFLLHREQARYQYPSMERLFDGVVVPYKRLTGLVLH